MSCKSIPHEVDLLPPVHVVPVKEEHLVNEEAVPNPSRSQQNSGYPEGNVDGCPGWTKQTKIRKGHRQAQETRVDEYQIATNPSLYLPAPSLPVLPHKAMLVSSTSNPCTISVRVRWGSLPHILVRRTTVSGRASARGISMVINTSPDQVMHTVRVPILNNPVNKNTGMNFARILNFDKILLWSDSLFSAPKVRNVVAPDFAIIFKELASAILSKTW